MTKILFIDYDDTLHDTDSKYSTGFEGILGLSSSQVMEIYLLIHRRIVHKQYPERHDDFYFHQSFIYEYLKKPYNENEARNIARRFQEVQQECWLNPSFFPDSLHFLDSVKERYTLCLTTGDYAWEKAGALEKAGGKSYFNYIFDHKNAGIKGGSTYFHNALRITGSIAGDVMVIGDNPEHDVAAAKEAGIATVWINRKGLPPLSIADYQARDLLQVLDHLSSL